MPHKHKTDRQRWYRKWSLSPRGIKARRLANKEWAIRKHQITLKEFAALRGEQRDRCFLCKKKFVFGLIGSGNYGCSIDHDHNCARKREHFDNSKKGCAECIRGLVCPSCNIRVVPGLELIHRQKLFTHPYLLRRPILRMRGE